RRQDKRILSFDRKFAFRNSGTVELPFGPGKLLFNQSSGILARVFERWQISPIVSFTSGAPFTFSSDASSVNNLTDYTPTVLGRVPTTGTVTRVSDGVIFFPGLKQIPDPGIRSITTSQQLDTRSTMQAITDASGNLLMVNPSPGELGNLRPLSGR